MTLKPTKGKGILRSQLDKTMERRALMFVDPIKRGERAQHNDDFHSCVKIPWNQEMVRNVYALTMSSSKVLTQSNGFTS
eukprot:4208883-Amphidinium_carterae.1